jgi:hypothetical protein
METRRTCAEFVASLTQDELTILAAAHDRHDLGQNWGTRLYLEVGIHPDTLRKFTLDGTSYYPPPADLSEALDAVRGTQIPSQWSHAPGIWTGGRTGQRTRKDELVDF